MRGIYFTVISLTAVAAAFVFISCGPQVGEAPRKPNIIFVFADDHAYQAIGAYGSKINQTPNIDRLAQEGMRFDRCLVTNSICAPGAGCDSLGQIQPSQRSGRQPAGVRRQPADIP